MSKKYNDKYSIVFFDGVCNLCNNFIDFLIKRDENKNLRYCSLQSDFAIKFFESKNISIKDFDTIYFYSEGVVFQRHKAIFNILKNLAFPSNVVSLLRYIPNFIGYPSYNFIAKRRYYFWGKKSSCRIASLEEKSLFLETFEDD
jgi:predicted DCC family thiol-disulfide oxidoreductase YuxK